MSSAAMPALRNIIRAATYTPDMLHSTYLGPRETGFHQVRGRQRGAGGLGAALDRAHRAALPVERGAAARALRRRSRSGWHRNPAFAAAHRELERALREIVRGGATGNSTASRTRPARAGRSRSLLNHREGLSVFLDRPDVSHGQQFFPSACSGGRPLADVSPSAPTARPAPGSPRRCIRRSAPWQLNGVDVLRWLTAWLSACADNGGRAPGDLSPWLPWSMDAERKRETS